MCFVQFSFIIGALVMEHVYSDWRWRKRRMCNCVWFMNRPEKRNAVANCLLLAYTRPILAPKKTHTQKPAPKCGTCLGNCKLVSLNINALSNPNRSEHSLHNCRVWRDILAATPNSSNLICVHWLQFMAQSQPDLAPGQLQT